MRNFLYSFPSHLNTEILYDLPSSCGAVRQSGGPSPFTGREFKHALPFPAIPIAPIKNVTYPLKPCSSRMHQTRHFKKHLNYCPAEECLTFCAPLMKSEIMGLPCILRPCSVIFLEPSAFFVFRHPSDTARTAVLTEVLIFLILHHSVHKEHLNVFKQVAFLIQGMNKKERK